MAEVLKEEVVFLHMSYKYLISSFSSTAFTITTAAVVIYNSLSFFRRLDGDRIRAQQVRALAVLLDIQKLLLFQ